MSSGMIECPSCKQMFDVAPWVEGKVTEKPRPWTCTHCKAVVDFKDENKKWEGLELINQPEL